MPFLKLRSQFASSWLADRGRLEDGRGGAETEILSAGVPFAEGQSSVARARSGLLATCSNPNCRTGWLHLWRRRSTPIFEGGWTCSAACTRTNVLAAVRREMEGRARVPELHRHRIPLGLTMLELGWITPEQLRGALIAQKNAGGGHLGQWLVRQQGVNEKLIARALGLQWSCPVLPVEFHYPEALAPLLPRLFVDAYGALPLRVAAGKVLYVGFEDTLDPILTFSIGRITGIRVESGIVQASLFAPAHARMLRARFPRATLIEAASEAATVHSFARTLEKARPVAARLVRIHDFLWLRMTLRFRREVFPSVDSVEDVICSIGTF